MPNSTRGSRVASPVATPASPSTDLKRRRFLFSLSASGAGAAAAAMTLSPAIAQATQPATAVDTDDAAYRETPHVRDYYRTTKL
jgi:hypothetical protein